MRLITLAVLASLSFAHAPVLAQAALPPGAPAGHPPVGRAGGGETVQDSASAAPDLPAGTIEVKLADAKGAPVPNTELKIGILFQKIAEGESRSERTARTDAAGVARFDGFTTGSEFSYRVSTRSGPAEYASDPIVLKEEMGVRVLLHVFPVTRDENRAMVGARGFVYVETRDDVFQFEVLFRVFNMGDITWVPENATMKLPDGFKAFKAGESMSDVRFEAAEGVGARLQGTIAPGQHNVSFRFQLPRDESASASFRFGLPPHTAEIRVIAEAASTMELDVPGFEKPLTDVNQNGQRVLVTRRQAKRGEPELKTFAVVLSGIPTPGVGRWIAMLIAAGFALLGFSVFSGKLGARAQGELEARDAARAKRVLLDELVELTRARREERIGPTTYESARRALVEALARILLNDSERSPGEKLPSKVETGRGPKKRAKKAGPGPRSRPSGPASTA